MKKLFREYTTYGKGDNPELIHQWVEEDTIEARQSIIDEQRHAYLDNEKTFLNSEEDDLYFSRDGGDWDDPTGGYITIQTREEALEECRHVYDSEVLKINKLFGEE